MSETLMKLVSPLFSMGFRVLGLVGRFGLTLYLAKYLPLPELGLFGLIMAATGLMPASAGWGINYYMNREIVELPPLQGGRMIRDRLFVTLITLVSLGLISLPILLGFHLLPNAALAILVVAIVTLESISFDIYYALISVGLSTGAAALLFTRTAAWVFPFVVLGYYFPELRSLNAALIAWLIALLGNLALTLWIVRAWPLRAILLSPFDHKLTFRVMAKARLTHLSDIGNAVTPFIDRYIVAHFLGLAATGVFTFYWSVSNGVFVIVSSSIVQPAFPAFLRSIRGGERDRIAKDIWTLRLKIVVATAIFSVAVIAVLPALLRVLGKEEVVEQLWLFWLLIPNVFIKLLSDSLSMELMCRHLDLQWALMNIFGGIITLVCSILFVMWLGLAGAAIGGIVSQFTLLIARWLIVKTDYRNENDTADSRQIRVL